MGQSLSTNLNWVHEGMYIILPVIFWLYVIKLSLEWTCGKTPGASDMPTIILLGSVSFFAFLDILYCAGILNDTKMQADPNWANIKSTLTAEICIGVVGILLAIFNIYSTFYEDMQRKKCSSFTKFKTHAASAQQRFRRG